MNKKYSPHSLEEIARKAWAKFCYEDIVELSLQERKISFLFEAEEETITAEEMSEVETQAQEALNELEKAIQVASDVFGDDSNTVEYLKTLGDEIPQGETDLSGEEPKEAAKKIAQKAGSSAQIKKVIASINAAIKTFGSDLSKLPLEKMGQELQKLPDDAEVKLASGPASGKDLKENWKSFALIDLAEIATEIQGSPDLQIDWSQMPGEDKMSSAAKESFKMEEPSGFLGKILSFFGLGGYDKSQFAEDMLQVSLEKIMEKYQAVPEPDTSDAQEASEAASELQGELGALNRGEEAALPPPVGTPSPSSQEPTEEERSDKDEEVPEESAAGSYKITPQDIRNLKAAMDTAKGKKKSQSKAMGSYLNQAVGQTIFEENFAYGDDYYDIDDLAHYRLMRMAGISEE